jgi:hypothetical protein
MLIEVKTETPSYTMLVDSGQDWAAIYEDGAIKSVGHPNDLREEMLDLLGVVTEYTSYDADAQTALRLENRAKGTHDISAERQAGWPEKIWNSKPH